MTLPPPPPLRTRTTPAVEPVLDDVGDIATCRRIGVLLLLAMLCQGALLVTLYLWLRAYMHVDHKTFDIWMESWGFMFFVFLGTVLIAGVGVLYLGATTALLLACAIGFLRERHVHRLRRWSELSIFAMPLGIAVGIYANVFLRRARKRALSRHATPPPGPFPP